MTPTPSPQRLQEHPDLAAANKHTVGRDRPAMGEPAGKFLERYQRHARETLLVWSLVATLVALALLGAARLGWLRVKMDFVFVVMAVAAGLLGAWYWRIRQMSMRGLACGLDGRWALHARLESTVELASLDTQIAVAQREDARLHLSGRRSPGRLRWTSACVLLAGVSAILMSEGTVLGWRNVRTKWAERNTAAAKQAEAAHEKKSPADRGPEASAAARVHASIEWKSPQSEITATSIEEVPLVAWLQSEVGIKSASLEILVNGTKAVSRPLDTPLWRAAAQPGGHELQPSLFLDELDVKPFDLVSYRLVVQCAAPVEGKVSSPPQFVQIRPVRRDVVLKGGNSPLVSLLMELKAAQLVLLKQNFTLTQLAADGSDPSWTTENSRVAAEQTALTGVVDRTMGLARADGSPPLVVENLSSARGLMAEAGSTIADRGNSRAVPLQERVLALLTELQQFIQQSLQGSSAAPDPFADREKFELPARGNEPAGKLEALAERQRKNNAKLADGNSGSTVAQEQSSIAREIAVLQSTGEVEADMQLLLKAAGAAAGNTAAQLAANDPVAARLPAAATARALDQALALQEKVGRASAAAALDRMRRNLNAAARSENPRELNGKRQEWRTALRALAAAQQRTGSAAVARELAALESRSNEPVAAISRAAAQTQVLLIPRSTALNRAIRPLRRVGQELGTGAGPANRAGLEDLEIASQEAEWLTTESATGERARKLVTQTDALLRSGAVGLSGAATAEEAVGRSALELATLSESGAVGPTQDEVLHLFNPADVDPRYRAAVENYFERLSRETRRPQPVRAP